MSPPSIVGSEPSRRSRAVYVCLAAGVILIGLASRRYPGLFPAFLGKYPGDALWALLVFLLCGIAQPRAATRGVSLQALVISVLDELSQLYHAPWIDRIRRTTLGHLILGYEFAWADIAAYCVGIALGAAVEAILLRARVKQDSGALGAKPDGQF